MTYVFRHRPDGEVVVQAASEEDARRLAMVKLYGERPDHVTPHAPAYKGVGLILLRTEQ